MPHVLAIAWIYREDYARAGMPVLPVIDRHGGLTGRQATLWAATLVPFSELPFLIGLTNAVYAVGALVLGLAQLGTALRFLRHRSEVNARVLFYASITYLPLLWVLMVLRKAMSVADLPTLNAALNATSGILLVIGYVLIRNASYRGAPADDDLGLRVLRRCFSRRTSSTTPRSDRSRLPVPASPGRSTSPILVPHVILAAAVLPMAILTLRRGLVRNDAAHRRIAKITLPVWLFVSVTGVIVYLMLYHW